MTRIDTTFKMAYMATMGYGVGIALKVNPKAMALAWICGEVALKVFAKVKDLPFPTVLAGSFVSLHLSTQQLIENSVLSHSIAISSFAMSSILMDKISTLFKMDRLPTLLNRLWEAASNSAENEELYAVEERGYAVHEETSEETSDEESDDYPQANARAYERPVTNRFTFT